MLFEPYVRFHIFISGYCLGAYWETAAHSLYDMFLIINLVFPTSILGVGISF